MANEYYVNEADWPVNAQEGEPETIIAFRVKGTRLEAMKNGEQFSLMSETEWNENMATIFTLFVVGFVLAGGFGAFIATLVLLHGAH